MGSDLPRLRAYAPVASSNVATSASCAQLQFATLCFPITILRLLFFRYNALKQGKVMEINDKCASASAAVLLLLLFLCQPRVFVYITLLIFNF
jgi:hypothetical protein